MLYINKQNPPADVIRQINEVKRSPEWRNIPEGDTVAIRAQFDLLPKDKIRKHLVKEQHGLCAYCMRRITENGSKTTIEHWMPLSKGKEKALDYQNMLGVCHGGRKQDNDRQRILCCDASKAEEVIVLDPQNRHHMEDIAYKKDGTIYSMSGGFEDDINNKLCLNGHIDKQGNRIDTSTEIVKGRRDAALWCDDFFRALDRNGKFTSGRIKRKMDEILQAEERMEFAGVRLFYLEKKYRALMAQGR